MADSNSADPTSYIGIEISTTFYAVSGRFFLRVRISATFLFPVKVQVKDSESQTPNFLFTFNGDYGSIVYIWLF